LSQYRSRISDRNIEIKGKIKGIIGDGKRLRNPRIRREIGKGDDVKGAHIR